MDGLLENITIYHKTSSDTWERYNVVASVRNTSYLNRNKTGSQITDNALIRVFDAVGYNNTWKCKKGDIIAKNSISDVVLKAPLTELRNKYGKENIFEVSSVEEFIFEEPELKELNHIKIGAR